MIRLITVLLSILILLSCNDRGDKNFDYQDKFSNSDSIILDSLARVAGQKLGDEKLALYFQSLDIAKQQDYPITQFRTYLAIASRYSIERKKDTAFLYLDSAKELMINRNLQFLMPEYHLALGQRYDLLYSDSSIYFLNLVLKDTAHLPPSKIAQLYGTLAVNCLGKKYYDRTKLYIQEALKYNHSIPNKNQNEALLYSYLYHAELGLNDTVNAIANLKKGIAVIEDSLGGKGPANVFRFMGDHYLHDQKIDSALIFYTKYANLTIDTNKSASYFLPNIHFADVYLKKGNLDSARYFFDIVEQHKPDENAIVPSTLLLYYDLKYQFAKVKKDYPLMLQLMETKENLEKSINIEIQSNALSVLEEKLEKAKSEKVIADKDQQLKEQKTFSWLLGIVSIAIAVIGGLLFKNQRRKKLLAISQLELEQKQLLLQKNKLQLEAESEERKRISQEIHDEIGPAITTLKLASQIISAKNKDAELSKASAIIINNTNKISSQVNDIVWMLNSQNDHLQSLVSYIRHYLVSFLEPTEIVLNFESEIKEPLQFIESQKRGKILQIIKEVFNNAVKYAQTKKIDMRIWDDEQRVFIEVLDNGVGLNDDIIRGMGNGLRNIKNNVHKINGTIECTNNKGLEIHISFPK